MNRRNMLKCRKYFVDWITKSGSSAPNEWDVRVVLLMRMFLIENPEPVLTNNDK